ncbi:MAG: hypothetical protein ABJA98_06120 [Acidobacteriota bacterium]
MRRHAARLDGGCRVEPIVNHCVALVATLITGPKYWQEPFITSWHFKREPDGSKWNPTACKIDPPVVLPP